MPTNNSWNNQINSAYNQIILNAGTNGVAISTDASAATVSVGTGGAVKTVTVGSTNTTSITTIACGTGGANFGTSANAHATVVGSTTAASTTTIQAPSAGVILTGVQGVAVANKNYVTINTATGAIGSDAGPASSISITGDTGGALTGSSFTFTGGTTGLSFGGSGSTETLTFAGITANGGTVSLATDATASTINIGTGAGAKTTTLGSTNTTSTTVIKSGTGNVAINSGLTIDSTGRNFNTVQPAFLAYLNTQDSNVTGNNTTWRLGSGTALTEIFDQGSNFNTNGTFTAPITGKYIFNGRYFVQGLTIATEFAAQIQTSNRNYQLNQQRVAGNPPWGQTITDICDMDAADTSIFNIRVAGEAANTADVFGDANELYTSFSGHLEC